MILCYYIVQLIIIYICTHIINYYIYVLLPTDDSLIINEQWSMNKDFYSINCRLNIYRYYAPFCNNYIIIAHISESYYMKF